MATLLSRARTPALALAGAAAYVQNRSRKAQRESPPSGRFLTVDGVRLHYLDEGDGPPLVMLHGLGSRTKELELSGLVGEASRRYRVIAFDRPGYGHSERPGRGRFGAQAQAALFAAALRELGIERPIVFGHSWGTLVAVWLALEHPGAAASLVLASGLYFPTPRADALLLGPPAIPVVGDLLRYTLAPLVGRLTWRAWLKTIFAPAPVPRRMLSEFPAWMTLRPSTLRAVAEEAASTHPAILQAAQRYAELRLPIVLVAGAADRYVSTRAHTLRVQERLVESRLLVSEGAGHMVHHTDLELVLRAIDSAVPSG